mmetsp:Transcript_30534/g.34813  ORF Transcript_30534/g.34813 Transcript_30534/m.34813 type:complete len:255 (+) Transcript_30534:410-1174(+)
MRKLFFSSFSLCCPLSSCVSETLSLKKLFLSFSSPVSPFGSETLSLTTLSDLASVTTVNKISFSLGSIDRPSSKIPAASRQLSNICSISTFANVGSFSLIELIPMIIGCLGLSSTLCFGKTIPSRPPSVVSTNFIIRRIAPDSLSVTMAGDEPNRVVVLQPVTLSLRVTWNHEQNLVASSSDKPSEESALSFLSSSPGRSISAFSALTRLRPSYFPKLAMTKSSIALKTRITSRSVFSKASMYGLWSEVSRVGV